MTWLIWAFIAAYLALLAILFRWIVAIGEARPQGRSAPDDRVIF
jgi:hypothetical protein